MRDPAGHYATLGVEPTASPEAIAAAYRRRARVLHPDVPGTGNAAAFIRLKQAYDVLSDAHHRAAYDRSATPLPAAAPPPPPVEPRRRRPDVSAWLSLVLAGMLVSAAVFAVVQRTGRPRPARSPAGHTTIAAAPVRPPAPPLLAVPASGPASFYVQPPGADAVVWRPDARRDGYVPAGRLAVFSPVRPL